MEVRIADQVRQLAAAFLTGVGIGLWFDVLQPVRRGGGKWTGTLWDILFLLTSGGAVFLVGIYTGAGMQLSFLCGIGGGFCLYLWSLHSTVREIQRQAKLFLQTKFKKR